ncbi:MAG TPA: hypothetical protein VJ203_10760 [Bacteroidales bacterium]|nr:hypothetical protein [Bacteroidales bacterium]
MFKLTILWLTLFSIAFGFVESAVVVYLREIYYPNGFSFPLAPMSSQLAITEIIREAATIIVLLSGGYLAGRNIRERAAFFMYCFAVWDIFYYVFLKLLINWPDSLFTWDILFLIPVIWTGPVIAPLLVSVTLLLLAGMVLYREKTGNPVRITRLTGILFLAGIFLVFAAFIWDFTLYLMKGDAFHQYIPHNFNWWLFVAGEVILLAGLFKQTSH